MQVGQFFLLFHRKKFRVFPTLFFVDFQNLPVVSVYLIWPIKEPILEALKYTVYIFCFISYGQCHETLTFHFCRQFFTLNFLKLFCLCTFERAVKRYDFLNKNNFSYSTATILNPFHKDIMGVKTPFYLKA